jgi:glucokinase
MAGDDRLVYYWTIGDDANPAIFSLNNHFDYMAVGIGSLINIFGPEKVVLGGGITEAGHLYVENTRQRVFAIAMKETSENTEILRASPGIDAPSIDPGNIYPLCRY